MTNYQARQILINRRISQLLCQVPKGISAQKYVDDVLTYEGYYPSKSINIPHKVK